MDNIISAIITKFDTLSLTTGGLYLMRAPQTEALPVAVLAIVTNTPTYETCQKIEYDVIFDISIFDDNVSSVLSKMNSIIAAFNYADLSISNHYYVGTIFQAQRIIEEDDEVFHGILTFRLQTEPK